MAVTWRLAAASNAVVSTSPATNWLVLLTTKIDANSGGAGAQWEKAGASTSSPRYLILRRKDGSPGRLIFFGQTSSSAHATAISGADAVAGSELWVGYSASSTANAPNQSWISAGPPLTASDFIKGVSCFPRQASITARLAYIEHADGILFLIQHDSHGAVMTGGGGLMVDLAGNVIDCVLGHGDSWVTASGWQHQAGTSWIPAGTDVSDTPTTNTGGCVARIDGKNSALNRLFSFTSVDVCERLIDTTNKWAVFFPVTMGHSNDNTARAVAGTFRQIMMGPRIARETTLNTTGPVFAAYGHGSHSSTLNEAVWFTKDQVYSY